MTQPWGIQSQSNVINTVIIDLKQPTTASSYTRKTALDEGSRSDRMRYHMRRTPRLPLTSAAPYPIPHTSLR